jgi:glucosylceramidase
MRWFVSARDTGERLRERPPLPTQHGRLALPRVVVDTQRRFQTHLGFGGAFTEAAAVTWQKLPPTERQQVLREYFSPTLGHGYTLCRVHMGSCDFALGNYSHVPLAEDFALTSFTIARDREALLPFIQAAQREAGAPLQLLASPWSPPPWMKSNGAMNGGGQLRPECRAAWAQCYVRFIQAYAAEGVPIWGVSVQNEPMAVQRWDSCIYSAEEERDFVRDHLGPALQAAGLAHIKLIVWDHNRDLMVQRAEAMYSDAQAAKYVWGMGFHWYGEDCFEHVQQVHERWPDKQLLFTEGCQEGGPHHGSWALGERYARSIINDLNRWTVGWIDWNLLLDHEGGPNHVGNLCSAPMLASVDGRSVEHQSSYWYLGHFARFIRPGAQRVHCATASPADEATAFVNVDGTVPVVVLNRSEERMHFELAIDGDSVVCELPPRALGTLLKG